MISRLKRCSDPRDHVYAMLNLVDQTQHGSVRADYTCSTNVTFARSAQAATEQQGTLDILAYATPASSSPTPGLASWIPEYDKASEIHVCINVRLMLRQAPMTKHIRPPSRTERRLQEELLVREPKHAPVFEIDDSGACAAILHCSTVLMGDVSTLTGMSNVIDQHDMYNTVPGPFDHVRLTLSQKWEDFLRSKRIHVDEYGPVLPQFYHVLLQELLTVERARISPIGSWRICFTPGGRACLVPASTTYDDQLVLLLDSHLPFIIRRCADERQAAQGSFTLIGPAYVHGLDVVDTLRRAHEGKLDNFHRIMLR